MRVGDGALQLSSSLIFSPVFLLLIPQQPAHPEFYSLLTYYYVGRRPYATIIRPSQPHRPIGLCEHGPVHYTKLYDLRLS